MFFLIPAISVYTVVLGTLSVLRSNALSTGQQALRGLLGTAVGFGVGGVLVQLIGTDEPVLWAVLPLAVLVAGFLPAAISFVAGQAAFTVLVMILFNLLQPAGWQVGLVRIEDVALGCAVSLLVGGIGIMNIMLVSVTERTCEVGTRLAIGALASEVLLQFLVEAVVLSMLGGVLGILFGLGLSYAATRSLSLPFLVSPQVVSGAFAFSAAVGVIFGFLPARKAARLNPIEALRHE